MRVTDGVPLKHTYKCEQTKIVVRIGAFIGYKMASSKCKHPGCSGFHVHRYSVAKSSYTHWSVALLVSSLHKGMLGLRLSPIAVYGITFVHIREACNWLVYRRVGWKGEHSRG